MVLLHNDRDLAQVREIYRELKRRSAATGLTPWLASEDMGANGDIFELIDEAINTADGAAFFLGRHGLGRYQERIEKGAVLTEVWLRGSAYDRVLVHLAPGLEVPTALLRWPTVNRDGSMVDAGAIAEGIIERFSASAGGT